MPKIDGQRLLTDLRRLADFGRYKTGVHRPTYSPEDTASRKWLAEKMAAAGLNASIDGVGNILGRPANPGKALLVGSHSETQNHAGWLDGALGVVYGLEVARAFAEDPSCAGLPIEVASWADEESHYTGLLGSRSFVGDLSEEDIDASRNSTDGTPLRTALERAGYAGRARTSIEPERYVGYLEAHIEQGDVLDTSGEQIGVVSSIVGIWQYRIAFEGVQNHAGTTRMAIRRDAGVALVDMCTALRERFRAITGPLSVWTTGVIQLRPGQPSIVPGGAEMTFQFRDADPAQMIRFERALEELVAEADRAGPCRVSMETLWKVHPVAMDESFQSALQRAAEAHCPGGWRRMPSAAGHDAQILARKIPAAMMFVPSIGGVSHHWSENTKDDDIVMGCQVMADAAATILREAKA